MHKSTDASAAHTSAPAPFHLSSRTYSGRDKVAALRELYGRELMRVDLCAYEGAERQELEFSASVVPVAEGVVYARCQNTPARMIRCVLPVGMPGAALALGYAQLLAQQPVIPAALRSEAAAHLRDLLAGIIHPAVPAALPPEQVAVDVSRLALIERDILSRIDQPQLSLALIARLHHLTPRQVQRLFARKGTCFSDFLSSARLNRAHAMLADPGQRSRRVLEIALDSGFDDVSAFSRAFRRHFGLTPSEVRSLAFGVTD